MLSSYSDTRFEQYTTERQQHWENLAQKGLNKLDSHRSYHEQLLEIYKFHIPKGSRVLEIGCGNGRLLGGLTPSYGVGIDFSPSLIQQAKQNFPSLTLIEGDVYSVKLTEKFDFIILSDVLNDLWDVQRLFKLIHQWCTPHTRIIMNVWSRLWQYPLELARKNKLARPVLEQNWFTPTDIKNILNLENYTCVKHTTEILMPFSIPVITKILNKLFAKLPLFNIFSLTHVLIARPVISQWENKKPVVSVVVPARNEAGNIRDIIEQTPELGAGTELIFVEGNSTDNTWETIQKEVKESSRNIKVLQQPGKGKGDAVRTGFAAATGDILMILDADLTVPAQDLNLFYDALVSGKCEFVNGVRLIYPMDKKAMKFCNFVANKGFSLIFSWLLGQPVKDTLCGTKVLSRAHYQRIAENRSYFGNFDPFGDYDLIFGAAKQNMHIADLPIRYRERIYGDTNINRWRHGVILLKMVLFAAKRIKFV